MSKNKNEMPRQESNNSQGQGSHGAPGKGGKKPGPPKPKNIGKTIKTLMHYVGRYKALLALVIILIVIDNKPTKTFITAADLASILVILAIPLFINTIPTYNKTTPNIFIYLLFRINYIFVLMVTL